MTHSISLYTAAQVQNFEQRAIDDYGLSAGELMERAGTAAFAFLRARWPAARRLIVMCGVGNNGGDGFVLARLAHAAGFELTVYQVGAATTVRDAALVVLTAYRAAGGEVQHWYGAARLEADVLVDALFGTGLTRAVSGEWRLAIEAINAAALPILSLDIPSGVHADSGAVLGAAVRATATVTFIARKQGLYTGAGLAHGGPIDFADLGVPDAIYADTSPSAQLRTADDLLLCLPGRARDAHKGLYGHVLVIGGDNGMSGAVRLAAEAAARVGVGLVTIATRSAHATQLNATRPELMCRGVDDVEQLQPLLARASVLAIGPGLGQAEWGRALLECALNSALPLVVDADALNLLAQQPVRRDNWILTPHPGEAARLLQCSSADINADRYHAVRELAAHYGGVAVLKGVGSLVACATAPVAVCTAGNPGMASGGMGDVLTGVIAGLLAQGLTCFDAARTGVLAHALAGDAAAVDGERGLLASDLFPWLRRLVNPSI
ncbi:MAG: NAD(P)H-hydrate dehydratase [Gammaproteobacteria bacterium]